MPITGGDIIEVSLKGKIFAQQQMLVFQYEVGGTFGPASPINVAEAWWNNMKASTRPLVSATHGQAFLSVLCRQISVDPGLYAEWAIPSGEWAGTGATGAGGPMPPFVAAAVRLTVPSGLTRPGQKRISGQDEGDANGANWETAYTTKLATWGAVISATITLGAPVIGGTLYPVVVHKEPLGAPVTVFQRVSGYFANPQVTSQVSRKVGRGS